MSCRLVSAARSTTPALSCRPPFTCRHVAEQAAYEHFKNGASSKCFGVLPATTRAKVPVAASFFHVLTFMVVGRKEAVNVQATCDVLSGVANVSFFYAHYDDAQPWYAKQAWYRRCRSDTILGICKWLGPQLVHSRQSVRRAISTCTTA